METKPPSLSAGDRSMALCGTLFPPEGLREHPVTMYVRYACRSQNLRNVTPTFRYDEPNLSKFCCVLRDSSLCAGSVSDKSRS